MNNFNSLKESINEYNSKPNSKHETPKIPKNIKSDQSSHKLLGKRNNFEANEPTKEKLSKNERRNKHSKMNLDFILRETQEKHKKKVVKVKEKNPITTQTTKFLLVKNNKGVDLNKTKNKAQKKSVSKSHVDLKQKVPSNKISLKMGSSGTIKLQMSQNNPNKRYSCFIPQKNNSLDEVKRNSLGFNNPNNISKMVWNSRGQCDEEIKLQSKINKVRTYWASTSLLIPNVFRHVSELDNEPTMLFEFLDLSKKELLVQANGQKAISQAGAPHLQRKNKSKKESKKSDSNINTSKEKRKSSFNSGFDINEQLEITFSSFNKKQKNQIFENQNSKDNMINKRIYKQSSCSLIDEPGLKKTNNKLENDNKITISESTKQIIKNNEENKKKSCQKWKTNSLEEFNNKLAEYNLLLEKEEKLKKNGILKNEKIAEMQDIFSGNKENETKEIKQEKIKKEASLSSDQNIKKNLLLKDIYQMESSLQSKEIPVQEKSKLLLKSKKITKTKKNLKTKKTSISNKKQINIQKEKDSIKKNENSSLRDSFHINRKDSEIYTILDISQDEDLEITVNTQSLLDFSVDSIISLEEHKKKINFRFDNQYKNQNKRLSKL